MIPAWTLVLALLAGAAAGWFARVVIAGRRAAQPRSDPVAPAPAGLPEVQAPGEPAEPALRMGEVLSELERRYQGRVAESEAPGKPPRPRSRRPPRRSP